MELLLILFDCFICYFFAVVLLVVLQCLLVGYFCLNRAVVGDYAGCSVESCLCSLRVAFGFFVYFGWVCLFVDFDLGWDSILGVSFVYFYCV